MTNEYRDTDWDAEIVALQQEMNIAELIGEHAGLDAYLDTHDEDDDALDRLDNVRDAICKTIYEDNQVIAITKWGRPVFNHAVFEHLINGSLDRAVVQEFVETRYGKLCKWYEWMLASTFVPRKPTRCSAVVKNLRDHGLEAVWETMNDSHGRWLIANPTYTQSMEIISNNGTKSGGIDYLMLIVNHDDVNLEQDDYSSTRQKLDRQLLEFTFGKRAALTPQIDVIPTLREIYGDKLAAGAEALPLMSPDGFSFWKFYYLGMGVYEPQVIDSKEAEMVA